MAQEIDAKNQRHGLLEGMQSLARSEGSQRALSPAIKRNDPEMLKVREDYYRQLLKVRPRRRAERPTRRYIRHELRRIKAIQKPTLLNIILFNRRVNRAFNWLRGRQHNFATHEQQVFGLQQSISAAESAAQITDKIRSIGLNFQDEAFVKKNVAMGLDYFPVPLTEPGVKNAQIIAHVKRLEGTDAYYVERFDAISRPTLADVIRGADGPKVSFSMVEGVQFTAVEAGNLVNGRPIQKEVDGQMVWFTRDAGKTGGLSEPFQSTVLDSIRSYNLKETQDEVSLTKLKETLAAGGRAAVTHLLPGGETETMKVGVSPNGHVLYFYNSNDRVVDINDHQSRLHAARDIVQMVPVPKLETSRMHI